MKHRHSIMLLLSLVVLTLPAGWSSLTAEERKSSLMVGTWD